ncbi:MAG: family 10 glycosylhydrolase [bacterium]|nr:family 10 glycosylhydrolase [bacterium]
MIQGRFPDSRTSPAPRRLIMGYCGTSLQAANMEAPIGVEGLVKTAIDPLRGTMVDTLYWQMNTDPYFGSATHHLTDWFSHPTQVGPVWGQGRERFKTAGEWRIYENARELIDSGTDPPKVIVEHGHGAGMDVFLGFRFNDGHDHRLPGGLDDPNMSPIKKEYPDWLLGISAGEYSQFAYNFAVPEVRRYRMEMFAETVDRYDLDGLDFDFCRWPILFRPGEGQEGAGDLTGMLRETKQLLEHKSARVGRPLYFSVRVPYDLDETRREGMDVRTWIRERIVDIVVVAGKGGGWNYRLPIEEYQELAAGTDCKIVAQNLDGFKENRLRSARVLFGEGDCYSAEMHRAVAACHWQAGADGIYIWNQDWVKFARDDRFDPQWWCEIGDPDVLAGLDKHYLVGPTGRGGSLPVEIAGSGDCADVEIDIADDPPEAMLRVMVEQLTSLDCVRFELNGVCLDATLVTKRYNYNDCWLDFSVADVLKRRWNRLSITVESRNPHVEAPLVVRSVEALVRYRS